MLLRGLGLETPADLEHVAHAAVRGPLIDYRDRVTRRTAVSGKVLSSTETPPHFRIELHCENSFAAVFPARILFLCRRPPDRGGRTPLADVRRVHRRLAPELRAPFERHGVLYVRNYGVGPGFSWQETFQTESHDELRAYCRASAIDVELLGGDRVRTRQVRPAALRHPASGAWSWMNHALTLHVSSTDAELEDVLERQLGTDELPQNTFYGDGTPIPDAALDGIREAVRAESSCFRWQPGDLLVVDNLAVAHGREAFEGRREVLVAMGEPTRWSAVESRPTAPELPLRPGPPERARRAAPADSGSSAGARRPPAAGSAVVEALVAALRELLASDAVAPGDNFLDLGGDSILAGRTIARVRERTGVELDLVAFFDDLTLTELAAARAPG